MDKFETLKKYKELLEMEVISQEEFDAKKQEVLSMSEDAKLNASDVLELVKKKSASIITGKDKSDKAKQNTPEVKELTEEEKAAQENKKQYDSAVKLLENRNSKKYNEAISILETLGAYEDAEQKLTDAKAALEVIKAEEEEAAKKKAEEKAKRSAKRKKIFKRVAIVAVIFFVVCGAIGCMIEASKPDLAADMNETTKDEIHSISFNAPASYEREEKGDSTIRYIGKKDGKIYSFVEVEYLGETDLSGAASAEDDRLTPDDASDLIPGCTGTYQDVTAGTSLFSVTAYCVEDDVKGVSGILTSMADSFDVDNYKNPRKSLGLDVSYTGSTKAGVKISSGSEDISVTEKFDTGVAKGTKEIDDWTIASPVTLKAGKTSEIKIKTGDSEKTIKVECSTLSKEQYKAKCKSLNYKNQLRKANYGTKIKIYGKVLQDCGSGYYRVGTSSSGYDEVYMVYAPDSDMVEDDWVSCWGETTGIYTYETVMGATKKIPSMEAKYTSR